MLTDTILHISDTTEGKKGTIEKLMLHYAGEVPLNGPDSFSAHPVLVTPEYVEQMEQLCQILYKALRKIVSHYFTDDRIKNILRVDHELENILRMAEGLPYEPGMYRPDFLYDLNGQPGICEIGARYPINGWMLSHYLNLISPELDNNGLPIPQQELFIEDIYHSFLKQGKMALVHENEKGTEVFYLIKEFSKKGWEAMSVKPGELEMHNGNICWEKEILTDFIFEMDREELKKFKPEVLREIIQRGHYFNDVRTLILVHDKRILAVLYDENIMQDYLAEEDYLFLRPFLIPTYALHTKEIRKELIHSERNWVLKLNSGGRGIGAYVKNGCTPEVWKTIIEEQGSRYMAQHYIDQMEFYDPAEKKNIPIHLVGMLLCRNDRSYGPGLFRGSAESIINVAQGRGVIFPAMITGGEA